MNRNLSDCAAMACLPAAAVVSWALPKGVSAEFMKELYLGMKAAGDAFDCPIVGGDTGAWDQKLAVSVTVLGRSAGVTPVRRSGARVGDAIYVTGPLGGSILGRHMSFTPRIREARDLVSRHDIRAMIDISDGLSRDLAHICRESGVGAILDASLIPIHDDARRLPGDPLAHALNDGEDHELCFTAPEGIDVAIRIGTIVEGSQIQIERDHHREPLTRAGFEHTF
jgi:thiamine-monophosphate kinase